MPDKRRFTILSSNVTLPKGYHGLFESSSPYTAARKATHAIYKQTNTSKGSVSFVLRETTQDSAKKEFGYTGTKRKLKEPKDTGRVDVNGDAIMAEWEYSVKSDRSA